MRSLDDGQGYTAVQSYKPQPLAPVGIRGSTAAGATRDSRPGTVLVTV
jgi:hypothetical protein